MHAPDNKVQNKHICVFLPINSNNSLKVEGQGSACRGKNFKKMNGKIIRGGVGCGWVLGAGWGENKDNL